MRKPQVQKAFESFCDGYLIPNKTPAVYGGAKCPQVHFEIAGIQLTYLPLKNQVVKPQTLATLVFDDAKSVLEYVKKMEAMKMNDPLYRGRHD